MESSLSDLELSDDDYSIKGTIAGDDRAIVRAEIQRPGVVNVTDIYRGELPLGSGGDLLALTLRDIIQYLHDSLYLAVLLTLKQ